MVKIILVVLALIYPIWKILDRTPDCYLSIYTYSSFTSSWGAGPALNKMFIDKHSCELRFEDVGDSRTILQRLKREIEVKQKSDVDVVLGLDQYSIDEAKNTTEWVNIESLKPDFYEWSIHKYFKEEQFFIPFDWAPLVFITNLEDKISSVDEILNHKYSLMEPRSSSPGFQFLVWILNGMGKDVLTKFKNSAHTISPSWSTAYGLFTKNEINVIFTYLTSLAYHMEKNETNYKMVEINKPYPYQVEFLGISNDSTKKDLGKLFIEFILSNEAQLAVMKHNYMLPVAASVVKGTVFENLPDVKLVKENREQKKAQYYIDIWKDI